MEFSFYSDDEDETSAVNISVNDEDHRERRYSTVDATDLIETGKRCILHNVTTYLESGTMTVILGVTYSTMLLLRL